jgi:hypothetical protein
MKKTYIILSIIAVVLIGAGYAWYANTSANSAFNKKIACSNLQSGLQQKIDAYNAMQKQTYQCSATDPCGTYSSHQDIDQLFYSPRSDTCIEVVHEITSVQTKQGTQTEYESYLIQDAFSGELKDSINAIQHGSPYMDLTAITNKIDSYK